MQRVIIDQQEKLFDKKFFVLYRERRRLHGRAYDAQQRDHAEVCGVLVVDRKNYITFWFLKNYSTNAGSYELRISDIRSVEALVAKRGKRVLGTFHSHPLMRQSLVAEIEGKVSMPVLS